MRDDGITAAIFAEMKARAGDQDARRWATTLGGEQVVRDYESRQQVALAVRLLNEGVRRADIRDRLVLKGLSRPTAYRRIHEALSQRDRHRETFVGQAGRIETTPSKP